MNVEIRKRLDLLGFQKNLNKQFLEIFENKQNQTNDGSIEVTQLGLGEKVFNYRFFFPLKDLKNISSDNRYESIALTKSWVTGFNQVRGDIFTIIDFHRIVEFIIRASVPIERREITNDSNFLYLKDQTEAKLGLVIDTLSLEHTAESTPLIKFKMDVNNKYSWHIEENCDFFNHVKQENMSEKEFELLSKLYELANEKKVFALENLATDVEDFEGAYKLLLIMISDVYLDGFGKQPVFIVNLQRLTKYLMSVSPF